MHVRTTLFDFAVVVALIALPIFVVLSTMGR
jgi:hypothetical protein